jgi:peptide chain release factor 2
MDVTAELDEDIEVEIAKSDVREDTYRASGAGGQHVNKTDSAIRLTHEPTGVVVQCQAERSQHNNRARAMKMLMSRLYEMELEKQRSDREQLYGDKGAIAWGSQIRSYVMQPYTMVKDHRTNAEAGNASGVLDGDLDLFIEAFLKYRRKQHEHS